MAPSGSSILGRVSARGFITKVKVSRSEGRALDALRGLPEDAHYLVMCMEIHDHGFVLEGSKEAFDALVSFISEAIADGSVSGDPGHLASLCVKIDPDCINWLGQ